MLALVHARLHCCGRSARALSLHGTHNEDKTNKPTRGRSNGYLVSSKPLKEAKYMLRIKKTRNAIKSSRTQVRKKKMQRGPAWVSSHLTEGMETELIR